jgi:hypothetical protein
MRKVCHLHVGRRPNNAYAYFEGRFGLLGYMRAWRYWKRWTKYD